MLMQQTDDVDEIIGINIMDSDVKGLMQYLTIELAILQYRYIKYFNRKHHVELINIGIMILAVKKQIDVLSEIDVILGS